MYAQLALLLPAEFNALAVPWSDILGIRLSRQLRRLADLADLLTQRDVSLLARKLRALVYDEALATSMWRIEYLHITYHQLADPPHYRLFKGDHLIGRADIPKPADTARVQRQLAAYLIGLNPRAEAWQPAAARTPYNTTRVTRRLF